MFKKRMPCYNALMSSQIPGVYTTKKKDGTIYYRSSITYCNKHISLGSFEDADHAHKAYTEADDLLSSISMSIDDYSPSACHIPFDKWVVLCNFRDNGVYISNPIYIRPKMFYYYFSMDEFFIFSMEDLFYYSAHRIQKRGGHYFVADYGSQLNMYARYGIKSHAVLGRDYIFLNGNPQDMQYANIQVLNSYHGVLSDTNGFVARIHVNGYLKIGTYATAVEAAIAYNKAADILKEAGFDRQFATNYIDGLSAKSYADIYSNLLISNSITEWNNQ